MNDHRELELTLEKASGKAKITPHQCKSYTKGIVRHKAESFLFPLLANINADYLAISRGPPCHLLAARDISPFDGRLETVVSHRRYDPAHRNGNCFSQWDAWIMDNAAPTTRTGES
jgi:hypothetical protein